MECACSVLLRCWGRSCRLRCWRGPRRLPASTRPGGQSDAPGDDAPDPVLQYVYPARARANLSGSATPGTVVRCRAPHAAHDHASQSKGDLPAGDRAERQLKSTTAGLFPRDRGDSRASLGGTRALPGAGRAAVPAMARIGLGDTCVPGAPQFVNDARLLAGQPTRRLDTSTGADVIRPFVLLTDGGRTLHGQTRRAGTLPGGPQ